MLLTLCDVSYANCDIFPTPLLLCENRNWARGPISCAWSSCTFAASPQREHYNITVVVKNQLGEETESYSFNISDHLNPVVEVVMVSPGVSQANVSWAITGNFTRLDFFCQVTTDPGSITLVSLIRFI